VIYSLWLVDYRKLDYGDNDNLDKRKEVLSYLQQMVLEYTLILNGAFMDNFALLRAQFDLENGVFEYWGDGETPRFPYNDTAKLYVAEAVNDKLGKYCSRVGEVLTMETMFSCLRRSYRQSFKAIR